MEPKFPPRSDRFSCGASRFDSLLTRFVAWGESIELVRRCGVMTATSSVIRGAWYLPDAEQLDLLFNSGRHYRYSGVPMAVARGFVAADSKGQFYNARIRNRFPCEELGRERKRA